MDLGVNNFIVIMLSLFHCRH